jgi:acyl carrier protein
MGLEGVEIVMAIEEEFKIAITDAEAAAADTVGKVVDLVLARLRQNADEPCPSQRGFYVIRKQLMGQLGLPRSVVKPDTRLEDLIPDEDRRQIWRNLIRTLTGEGNASVALLRPKWMDRIVTLVIPAIVFGLTLIWVPLELFWLGLFPALFAAYLGDKMTTPWKTQFPSAFSRVKDLIPFVKTLDCRVWSKDEVFDKVRVISVGILGVKPEQVKLETFWVKDLGVG